MKRLLSVALLGLMVGTAQADQFTLQTPIFGLSSGSTTSGEILGETTGPHNNVALVGTNGLTAASYSASNTYHLDIPAGGFDGYDYSGLIHGSTPLGKHTRGMWVSPGGTDQWLQVDFGSGKLVRAAGIVIQNPYPVAINELTYMPQELIVQGSTDGSTFADIQTYTSIPQVSENVLTFSTPTDVRILRLHFQSNYGAPYYHIGDVEVFQ